MRSKKLLSTALAMVLIMASSSVSQASEHGNQLTGCEETALEQLTMNEEGAPAEASEEAAASEPETAAKETPAAEAPVTEAPSTEAPATEAPATEAPATEPPTEAPAPETQPPTEAPPAADTEASSSEAPAESETSQTTESDTEALPSETAPGTAQQTEGGQTEKETDSEKETEVEEKETESENNSPYKTNAELIAHQNIVVPPDITREFRFTTVDERLGIVRVRDGAGVYESKSEDSRLVGELAYYGCLYILEDKEDGWYYVESGNVRGFVKSEDVVTDETALRIQKIKGADALPTARLLVARTENDAFDYTHTTVQEVMADPVYALAKGSVNIYERSKDSARVIGTLSDQALCYVLADEDKDWVFVESGNARGFVQSSQLTMGAEAQEMVASIGESNLAQASVLVQPEDNKACYYTLTSVKKASQASYTREAMVNFALQFVGNPYVWGGTSLTNGADCSGFVQSIYAYFGYSLPRVAEDQACYGTQIPIGSAQPGDLIFYAKNGYVYHVSMYIGNGQVVQAANSRVGIITSGIGGDAVWATRIISD
jgi:cell wall-associated NlpC family hydrolase